MLKSIREEKSGKKKKLRELSGWCGCFVYWLYI